MKTLHFRLALILIPVLAGAASLAGCSAGKSAQYGTLSVTAAQKRACLQMTTFCENDPATTLQFNYAANIGDGSGITFGCIGFTTGTYSGNILIKYYTTLNPNNILAKYIPALNRIDSLHSGGKSDDTTGLDGFIRDVQNCTDPLFKQAQLYQLDQMYWSPALAKATELGAKYQITLAFIYDTCVNHGAEGADNFIVQTNAALGGSPATGIPEVQWLTQLIQIRFNYFASRNPGATDRCSAYQRVLDSGNYNLTMPFSFRCYGDTCTINGNLGY